MSKGKAVVDGLSSEEKKTFRQCETVIRKGVKTFVQVGVALKEIQDQQLYREKHSTFDEYCKQRWEMSRSYAYRLIDSAKIAKELTTTTSENKMSPMGDKSGKIGDNKSDSPKSERQVRPLRQLRSVHARREVWDSAVKASRNGMPTAAVVEELAAKKAKEEGAVVSGNGDIARLRLHSDPDGIASWVWEPVAFDTAPPALMEDRLAAVLHSRPPVNSEDPEDRTVIVCPGADLFAAAVPDSAIEAVLVAAEGAPHWTFLLISKNYLRLYSYAYPKNVWAGAHVTSAKDFEKAEAAAVSEKGKPGLKFLYCCPLSDSFLMDIEEPVFKWVVICGSDPQPDSGDVMEVSGSAIGAGVPMLWAESLAVRLLGRPLP